MHQPIDKPVVIIGYGSTLRGDDAVGRLVVEWLADRNIPNVVTVSATQLVPELSPLIARAQAVIFVDACVAECAQTVELHRLSSEALVEGPSHFSAPSELLALAAACYAGSPPAWLVSVPAADFEFTDEVSLAARNNIIEAARAIERLIESLQESEVAHA